MLTVLSSQSINLKNLAANMPISAIFPDAFINGCTIRAFFIDIPANATTCGLLLPLPLEGVVKASLSSRERVGEVINNVSI